MIVSLKKKWKMEIALLFWSSYVGSLMSAWWFMM